MYCTTIKTYFIDQARALAAEQQAALAKTQAEEEQAKASCEQLRLRLLSTQKVCSYSMLAFPGSLQVQSVEVAVV